MTAAVAGRAAAAAGGKKAAQGTAKNAATKPAASGGGGGGGSSSGLMDAFAAGGEKRPQKPAPAPEAPRAPERPKKEPQSGLGKLSTGSATGAQKILVAEFILCILILGLSPLVQDNEKSPRSWMKSGSAMCGVFIILGMVSAIGPKAGRAAAALGGLVTLVLFVDQRGLFGVIAERLTTAEEQDAQLNDPTAGGDGTLDNAAPLSPDVIPPGFGDGRNPSINTIDLGLLWQAFNQGGTQRFQ